MPFADRKLAERLEAAEAFACAEFATARSHLFPECGSTSRVIAGATAVFDGVDAPTTQSFGMGLFEPMTPAAMEEMEVFFLSRGTEPMHEVCPLAGTETLDLLCARGYRPFEISNVLYRSVEREESRYADGVTTRQASEDEAELWTNLSTRGWTHEHPDLKDFVQEMGTVVFARRGGACFLAELDGQPGAAGALSIHEGVALFAGAATVPECRRRGLQAALLAERMRYARASGCDLAMMVAEAGSLSQRNAERQGFRVAYTRLKWKVSEIRCGSRSVSLL
ncbi:MAG: GNAT family N-acetyltransferase [Acidobacteriota bacterium]|nr:GNAT family N-acetyltransferase [Acidobacteriota bacterium]